jgi:hypothetical protein
MRVVAHELILSLGADVGALVFVRTAQSAVADTARAVRGAANAAVKAPTMVLNHGLP